MKWLKKNTGPNRRERRAQYGTPSSSKPLCRRSARAMQEEARGRQLIEALIARGIMINAARFPRPAAKTVRMERIAASVKHALRAG